MTVFVMVVPNTCECYSKCSARARKGQVSGTRSEACKSERASEREENSKRARGYALIPIDADLIRHHSMIFGIKEGKRRLNITDPRR